MAIRTRDRNAILVGAAASTLQGFLAMKQRKRDRADKRTKDAQQQVLFDQQRQLNEANIVQQRGAAARSGIETQRLLEDDAARRGIEGSKGFLGRQIDSTIDATFKAKVDAQNAQFAKEEQEQAQLGAVQAQQFQREQAGLLSATRAADVVRKGGSGFDTSPAGLRNYRQTLEFSTPLADEKFSEQDRQTLMARALMTGMNLQVRPEIALKMEQDKDAVVAMTLIEGIGEYLPPGDENPDQPGVAWIPPDLALEVAGVRSSDGGPLTSLELIAGMTRSGGATNESVLAVFWELTDAARRAAEANKVPQQTIVNLPPFGTPVDVGGVVRGAQELGSKVRGAARPIADFLIPSGPARQARADALRAQSIFRGPTTSPGQAIAEPQAGPPAPLGPVGFPQSVPQAPPNVGAKFAPKDIEAAFRAVGMTRSPFVGEGSLAEVPTSIEIAVDNLITRGIIPEAEYNDRVRGVVDWMSRQGFFNAAPAAGNAPPPPPR